MNRDQSIILNYLTAQKLQHLIKDGPFELVTTKRQNKYIYIKKIQPGVRDFSKHDVAYRMK